MIGPVDGDKNGARHAGDERDDEPSPSGIVWSLSQEYEAQVARWAQIPVWAGQNHQQVQRALDAVVTAAAAAIPAAAAADAAVEKLRQRVEKARQTFPKEMLDLLTLTPSGFHAERAAQSHDAIKRIAEQLSADVGSAPVGYYPPNWWSVPQLDGDAATAIMHDEGIPLAWVPRAEVVADLIAAPDAAVRDTILVARTPEIVVDCRQRLAEVRDAGLQHLDGLIDDALRALEQSNPTAAQALAANVFDTLLRDVLRRGRLFAGSTGRFKYQHVTGGITPVSDETLIGVYRASCVLTPVLKALAEFNFEADPVPGRFTRHATAHRAGMTQYTPANAVIAIMLATSLLREAQESGW
jgi:hypothetical protein